MLKLMLLLLSGFKAARGMSEASPDFALPGPCTPASWRTEFNVASELAGLQLPSKLPVNITLPQCTPGAVLPFGSPFPLLFFFNGFMNRAAWYFRLVHQVASWGIVTVQYDTPFFPILTVASELQLFPHLVQWVADQADDPSSPLYDLVDMGRVATAGHSRGGKLAALAFTGHPELVQAAYLVDPVDVTRWSPESPDNPSAARALAASGRAVGISAAGLIGSCNPADAGYQVVFAAAGNGSWLGLIPGASHSQFLDAGCVGNAAADLLCGKGPDSRRQVAELTATPLLAWLWLQLAGGGDEAQPQRQGGKDGPSPLPAFFGWVQEQEAAGVLQFSIKETDDQEAVEGAGAAPQAVLMAAGSSAAAEEEPCAPVPRAAGTRAS